MQNSVIVIEKPGSYLKKAGGRFEVKRLQQLFEKAGIRGVE